MKFSNPHSYDLGVWTWADLQTTYANGGGALAALPVGARAFVSDWGVLFSPNAAKTYWRPLGPVYLGGSNADVTQLEATSTAETLAVAVTLPTKLFQSGGMIHAPYASTAPTNGANKTTRIRFDTSASGVTGTTIAGLNAGASGSAAQDVRVFLRSGTAQWYSSTSNGFTGTSSSFGDPAFNTDTTVTYLKATLQCASTGVSLTLAQWHIHYLPGVA